MSGEGLRFAGGLPAIEQHFDPDLTLVGPAVINIDRLAYEMIAAFLV